MPVSNCFARLKPSIYHFLQRSEPKTRFSCSLSLIVGPLSGTISSLCWVSLPFPFSQRLVMIPLSLIFSLSKTFSHSRPDYSVKLPEPPSCMYLLAFFISLRAACRQPVTDCQGTIQTLTTTVTGDSKGKCFFVWHFHLGNFPNNLLTSWTEVRSSSSQD